MAASVLYFGPDEWNRVQVLESAGYAVHQCLKISDLEFELKNSPQPSAVVMNSFSRVSFVPAIELVHRQAASARIIAFPNAGESGFEKSVDLVVPPLTSPDEWLKEMAALLERSREIRDQAIVIQEQSTTLVQQMADSRELSAAAREKSAAAREKSAAAWAASAIECEKSKDEIGRALRRVAGSTKPFDPQEKS